MGGGERRGEEGINRGGGPLAEDKERALDSKQRLHSPANAPVVFSVGGVS